VSFALTRRSLFGFAAFLGAFFVFFGADFFFAVFFAILIPQLRLRAMNALTISRARSVWGPGVATHSCSQPSKSSYRQSPPADLYVAANFSWIDGSTLSSSAPCMTSSGTSETFSRRSRISWGLLSWIVSHGAKNVVVFF